MEESTIPVPPQPPQPPTLEQKQFMTKIISEGTYGCVLHPGITCENKPTPNYITKIQMDGPVIQNEITVGQSILQEYGNRHILFFAPIIKTCNVQQGEINNDEIQKCKIIQQSSETPSETTLKTFVNSKIRYIGKITLNKLFQHISTTPPTNNNKLIDTYTYLLKSIQMLLKIQLVHMDIKDNNIMYDPDHYVPILIDFGLTKKMPLTFDQSAQYFQKYEIYISWSIEIFILSQICKNPNPSEIITEETATNLITTCMTNIDHTESIYQYTAFFQPSEIETFKTAVQTFIKSHIGYSYNVLHDKLMESYPTWDMYSLSVTFLFLAKTFPPPPTTPPLLPEKYINIFKNHILAPPTERETIEAVLTKIHP